MNDSCCGKIAEKPVDPHARRILWAVLIANAAMFVVEIIGGHAVGSISLQADALDFGSDAATYAITLLALGMSATARARAGMIKGLSMAVLGVVILTMGVARFLFPVAPEALPMGAIGVLAIVINGGAALLLLRFRKADANLRSAWLCSRNDVLGNVLVIGAASVTAVTHSAYPDLLVGAVMAALFLNGAWSVLHQARTELRGTIAPLGSARLAPRFAARH